MLSRRRSFAASLLQIPHPESDGLAACKLKDLLYVLLTDSHRTDDTLQ